jgi:hypothetical protein
VTRILAQKDKVTHREGAKGAKETEERVSLVFPSALRVFAVKFSFLSFQ